MAAVVEVPDRAPPPLTVQLTPAAFLSCVTTADNVTESVASTLDEAAVTATLIGAELPPQPYRDKDTRIATTERTNLFQTKGASEMTHFEKNDAEMNAGGVPENAGHNNPVMKEHTRPVDYESGRIVRFG